jgi:hypothetical protein
MKTRYGVVILWIALGMTLNEHIGLAQNANIYMISIPAKCLNMSNDYRITKYKITVKAGHIAGLLKIPQGWDIAINDNLKQYTVIDGIASHGVAYMTFDDVVNGAFDSFLIVAKDQYLSKAGVPLDISIKFTTALMSTLANREVTVKMSDLVVNPYLQ